MASYETHGNSTRAVVLLPNGKKLTRTFDTKAEAIIWATEQEKLKALGKVASASGITAHPHACDHLAVFLVKANNPLSIADINQSTLDLWVIAGSERRAANRKPASVARTGR